VVEGSRGVFAVIWLGVRERVDEKRWWRGEFDMMKFPGRKWSEAQ